MSSFTSPLIVTPLDDGRRWRLWKEFSYHIDSEYSKDYVHVPAGFVTDFASVPWVFWTFLPTWGRYGKGAVLHDFLYQNHAIKKEDNLYFTYSRKMADDIFYEAMIIGGTKAWKARLMWLAVRLFAFLAWKE